MAKMRVVRDPIYGYIQLPGELAGIVDHPLYQRLRRVLQTSLTSAVYPSATGTRFEHGLGAMHLAMRGWNAAWLRADEPTRDAFRSAAVEDLPELAPQLAQFRELMLLAVGGAALLHDIGHPPFSHVLEPLYERLASEHFGDDPELMEEWLSSGLAYHEFAGQRLARVVTGELPNLLQELTHLVYEADEDASTWSGAAHGVIAGEVDIDRLDYLMRDAGKAGTEFGAIDYVRLVDALELKRVGGGFKVAPGVRARSAVETLVLQRTQTYKWIIYHTRVVGANLALARAIEQLRDLSIDEHVVRFGEDEHELGQLFRPLWPVLNYVRPRVSEMNRRVRVIMPESTHDDDEENAGQLSLSDQEAEGALEDLAVELQASVDDAVVLEALKNARILARFIAYSASLDRSVGKELERLTTYTDHALHRAKNCLSAWKTTEEFESTCRRLKEPLVEAIQRAFEEVEGHARFKEQQTLRGVLATERDRLLHALEENPTIAANQIITLLFANEARNLDGLVYELDGIRHELEGSSGFWDAAYTGFIAVRHGEGGAVLFDGETQVALFESSALARALEQVEQSRYRLCVFFFMPQGIPRGGDVDRFELREKLVGEFVSVFPRFVERTLPTVLSDSFAAPEPFEGATP